MYNGGSADASRAPTLGVVSTTDFWNERYGATDFAYGEEPNDFLAAVADRLPAGRALCLAEGEGRNAVFLAQRGMEVEAVDLSSVALQTATHLARERGVALRTVAADLENYPIAEAHWDVVTSIWCHLPQPLRGQVHRAVVRGLRPGGMLVLESYTPAQLAHDTGGPRTRELLVTLDELRSELADLEFLHAQELEREVFEGRYHTGLAAVVQLLARKRG
jgi:SAM-dependent methyltransferase